MNSLDFDALVQASQPEEVKERIPEWEGEIPQRILELVTWCKDNDQPRSIPVPSVEAILTIKSVIAAAARKLGVGVTQTIVWKKTKDGEKIQPEIAERIKISVGKPRTRQTTS